MNNYNVKFFTEIQKLGDALQVLALRIERVARLDVDKVIFPEEVKRDEMQKLVRLCDTSTYSETVYMFHGLYNYFQKPRMEGNLRLNSNGRYRLDANDYEFTCGDSIEVYEYDDYVGWKRWHFGRVEFANDMGGYYFTGDKELRLYTGMRAAIRI